MQVLFCRRRIQTPLPDALYAECRYIKAIPLIKVELEMVKCVIRTLKSLALKKYKPDMKGRQSWIMACYGKAPSEGTERTADECLDLETFALDFQLAAKNYQSKLDREH